MRTISAINKEDVYRALSCVAVIRPSKFKKLIDLLDLLVFKVDRGHVEVESHCEADPHVKPIENVLVVMIESSYSNTDSRVR